MNPFVSVIIPNYCHSKYLVQRIESVLSQTYQNFEIIILDDCSPDNGASREIIERYRENEHVSKIVYNEENSGSPFIQWQRGFALAKGDYIWIAESDDYCEPTFLEELINAINSSDNCVLAYSTLMVVDEYGRPNSRKHIYRNQYIQGTEYLKHYLSIGCSIKNASSAIFRKDVLNSIGDAFSEYKAAGDYLFWVLVAEQGNVAIVNKQLSYFRRHNNCVTNKQNALGTNYFAEKKIYDYIASKVSISPLRKFLVFSYHAYRIRDKKFQTEEIRKNVFDCWQVDRYSGFINYVVCKIAAAIRYYFHCYI